MLPDDPDPMKVVHSRSTSKKMIACFLDLKGHIAIIPLEGLKIVNAKWYTEIYLTKVINKIRENNKNRHIIPHYNN